MIQAPSARCNQDCKFSRIPISVLLRCVLNGQSRTISASSLWDAGGTVDSQVQTTKRCSFNILQAGAKAQSPLAFPEDQVHSEDRRPSPDNCILQCMPNFGRWLAWHAASWRHATCNLWYTG